MSAFARAKKFSTLNEVTRIATPPDRRDRHGYTSSTGPTVPQCCPQLVEVERHTGHGAHGAGIVPLDDCVGQGAQELKDELDSTRRQRDMLLAWRQESAKEATRIRSMWDLAEAAADRLPAMSIEEKAEVFAILAIRITVLDPPPDAPARGGRDGGYGPAKPRLRIEGSVPHQQLLEAIVPGNPSVAGLRARDAQVTNRLPFEVTVPAA